MLFLAFALCLCSHLDAKDARAVMTRRPRRPSTSSSSGDSENRTTVTDGGLTKRAKLVCDNGDAVPGPGTVAENHAGTSNSNSMDDASAATRSPIDASLAATSETTKGPSIKILNMNVNGLLKAFARKGKRLETLLKEQDPDIVVFTETHYDPQVPLKRKEEGMAGYQRLKARYPYVHIGVNPGAAGRAGVAVYSKLKPLSVVKTGLPTFNDPATTKGRYVSYEFASFYLVAVYSFHSGDSNKLDAHKVRQKWDAALREHLHHLDTTKPVICVGDQNVAPTNDDVHLATGKLKKNPVQGCILPHERKAWFRLLQPIPGTAERPLIDVWRNLHPDTKKLFTHTGIDGTLNFHSGFRLDHFVVSERIMAQVQACEILSEETAMSDHIPIVLDIHLED